MRIQRFRPAAFCCQDFFLLHDTAPVYKAASVGQFLTKKCYNPLSLPVLSIFISVFSVPQVKNAVKKPPLCVCCWDLRSSNWLIKEGPKRGNFGSFSETVRPLKSLYICQWSLFCIKKKRCLPHVSSIFKISPKTSGLLCVYRMYTKWVNRLQEWVLYIKIKQTFHTG